MFHRVPFISPTSVVTAAVTLVLATLFALSLSSPGAAHAEDNSQAALDQETLESRGDISFPVSAKEPDAGYRFSSQGTDLPEVSIYAVMPEVGEEGRSVTVTLKLSRPLRADEKFCYPSSSTAPPHDEVCIQGGIIVLDTYDDHLYEEGGSKYDDGFIPSNELIKFVFRGTEVEKRLRVLVYDDECITPGRTVRIKINPAFHSETYGYTGDATVIEVPVNGNDTENGEYIDGSDHSKGECESVDEGATEEFVHNHAPLFDGLPPTFSIAENTPSNQNIGEPVTATDSDDGDTLTYSLQGTDSGSFTINSSTGQIKTYAALDHETKDSYHVAVFVRDSKDISGDPDTVDDDSIDVTINVTDVNEAPEFDSTAPTALDIVENTIADTDIDSPVTATDPDNTTANPTKDTLTYSLDTGDGASFEIDSSGQIKTKEPLDRETKPSYTVTVSVSDNKDATGAADSAVDDSHTVTITIGNEVEPPTFNEEPPQGQNSLARSVAENTPGGRPIGNSVSATSEDGATLTYSLDDQDGASFEIDSTGQIKTKDALDYEDTQNIYSVTVSVTDGKDVHGSAESPAVEDDSIDVTINVTDVNEKPQFADDAPATQNVDENTPAGTNIGSAYTATDPDAGDTLTYSLDDGDGAAFDIDANGQIKTKADLNYEADPSYTVIVQVTDSRDDSGTTEQTPVADDTHTVTITIDNEVEPPTFDEEIPQGQASLSRSIPENTTAGRPIGDPVSATSEDGATLIYSLEGTDAASFDFDTGTGQIKTRDALDYEDTNSYSVTVSITDGKDVHGNTESPAVEDDSIAVTINVTDVNEKPVFADDASITQTVAENTAADTDIGSAYTATDDDQDTLTYSLGGADAASFAIDDSTGQLKTKGDLNYEADSSYTVIVQVTDSKDDNGVAEGTPTVDDTHAVTITLTDQDDDGTITFSSDTPAAGTTLTATLKDDDGVKATPVVAWLWESSTDQNNWTTVNGADTDSLTLGTGDVGNYYQVTATYDDELAEGKTAVGETTNAVVTAPPTNQNPEFADATATREVAENTPAGQNIGAPITATHADGKGTLVYSLDTTGADTFDIDSSTGQLKTKTVFDYEIDGTNYTVTVSVSDSLDSYSNADTAVDGSITVTINVTDVNEPPQFADDAVTALEVSEDTTIGVGIGEYEASDPDPSDTVTYSVSGTDAALFEVDLNGQLKVKESLDFEDKSSLAVVVEATDSRDDAGTLEDTPLPDDIVAITITVTNIFEDPRFNDDNGTDDTTRTIPENTVAGQPVGLPVSATDDEDDTLTYELGGSDAASFDFDTATGQIKTLDPLDHEDRDTYSVTVSVTDGKDDQGAVEGSPQEDTFIYVDIEVADVNEPPEFDANLENEPSIAENTAAGTNIGSPFTATDPDDGETLTYGLSGTDAVSFDIDAHGQIKTKAALDHETKETYTVTVTVSDGRNDAGDDEQNPVADATITVTITVTDVDDPGTIALSPTQPSAGNEVTATLEDGDGIKTDVDVTWKWEKSSDLTDPNSWTTIDGATTNTYIPQEGDEGDFLRVTATYDDELGAGKTAQKVSDSEVLDMPATNESPAFDANRTITLNVQENTPAGENIGDPFTATDTDTGDTLTYALDDQDGASFEIDSSGQIKTKSALDHETKDTYSVTVSVHDGNDPFGNPNAAADGTIDVTIDVTDMVIPAIPEQPTVNATPGAAAGLTVTWTAIEPTDDRARRRLRCAVPR